MKKSRLARARCTYVYKLIDTAEQVINRLLYFSPKFIEEAKVDAKIWQVNADLI
jgi:hypothetical protein